MENFLPLNGKDFVKSGIFLHILGELDFIGLANLLYIKQNKTEVYFGMDFANKKVAVYRG